MNTREQILILDAEAAQTAIGELAEILLDCVEGGASVGFMAPLGRDAARQFFGRVAAAVAREETLLVAASVGGRLMGTVQVGLDMPPNQPHRGDIKKLLVHRAARRLGLGAKLMACAEAQARRRGRTLLVLDTADAAAARLYERAGWQRAGCIPGYALWPHGGACATTFYWKALA